MTFRAQLILLLFLFYPYASFAKCASTVYVGPEVFHIKRWREGGTEQNGRMDGVRLGYDRIKRYGWYLGLDGLYATGDLKGKNPRGRKLRSDLTDIIFEIRGGYTLQKKAPRCPFYTPFVGWGKFHETNDFHSPSPVPYTFTDTFNYIALGFLSGFNFTPLLSMGINFKVKFMNNGSSKITDDPVLDDRTLTMGDALQMRLDVPFTYCLQNCLKAAVIPFYEYRHFGGKEGYPFNYIDTKFRLLGARAQLSYNF